jgi:hypothetical protein
MSPFVSLIHSGYVSHPSSPVSMGLIESSKDAYHLIRAYLTMPHNLHAPLFSPEPAVSTPRIYPDEDGFIAHTGTPKSTQNARRPPGTMTIVRAPPRRVRQNCHLSEACLLPEAASTRTSSTHRESPDTPAASTRRDRIRRSYLLLEVNSPSMLTKGMATGIMLRKTKVLPESALRHLGNPQP